MTILVPTWWSLHDGPEKRSKEMLTVSILKVKFLDIHWLLTTLKFLIFRCVKEGEFLKSVSFLFRFCIPDADYDFVVQD